MSKPKRLKTNINQVVWHRQDENDILESINDTLKGHEDECHKCLFFDFNDLMNLPKSVHKAFAVCLFKIDTSEKGSLGFRNQDGFLREFFELTEIVELYPLTKRIIKMEGIHEGSPVNKGGEEKLMNSSSDQYHLMEKTSDYLEIWEGPKVVRNEIIKLEILLNTCNIKFSRQLDHLISLQEEEYHIFEIQKDSFRGKLGPKEISDHLLSLRSFHNKELEEIKNFQDSFISYLKRTIKKLSIVASEISILENICKIETCTLCGHITRMSTDRPSEIPRKLMTKNGSIASMENSGDPTSRKRDSQGSIPSEHTIEHHVTIEQQDSDNIKHLTKTNSASKRYAHPRVVNLFPDSDLFKPKEPSFPLTEGLKVKEKPDQSFTKSPKANIDSAEISKLSVRRLQRKLANERHNESGDKHALKFDSKDIGKNLNKTLPLDESVKKTADFGERISNIRSNSTATRNEGKLGSLEPITYSFASPDANSKIDFLKSRLEQKTKESTSKGSQEYKINPTFNKRDSGLSIAIGSPSFSLSKEHGELKQFEKPKSDLEKEQEKQKKINGYSDEFNFQFDDLKFRYFQTIDNRDPGESNLLGNDKSFSNSKLTSTNQKKSGRDTMESSKKEYEDAKINSKDILPFLAKVEATREVLNDLKEERKKKERVPSQSYLEFINISSNKYNERVQHQTKRGRVSQREPIKLEESIKKPPLKEKNFYGTITPSERDSKSQDKPGTKSKSVNSSKLKDPTKLEGSAEWDLRPELNEVFKRHENSFNQYSPSRREKLENSLNNKKADTSLDSKMLGHKKRPSISKKTNILQNQKNFRNMEESLPRINNPASLDQSSNQGKASHAHQSNLRNILKELGKELGEEIKTQTKINKTFEGKGIFDEIKKNWNPKKPVEDKEEIIDPERDTYMNRLIIQKPWLSKHLLKPYRLTALKANFPIDETRKYLTESEKAESEREIRFIKEKVEPYREKPRELKSDLEISYDVRYYNKYGDFLLKRITQKNYYERLDLDKNCTENEIKTAYRAKALIWHPDNCKKNYKSCFANEEAYIAVTTEIFALIDEAYRTLSHPERKNVYDVGLHHNKGGTQA